MSTCIYLLKFKVNVLKAKNVVTNKAEYLSSIVKASKDIIIKKKKPRTNIGNWQKFCALTISLPTKSSLPG